jgi:hypothetical protein
LTVIGNITVAEFNETAFKAAVIEDIQTTVVSTAVATVQVVITSAPRATGAAALRNDNYLRRLQASDNSVTVAYDVTSIPDIATANVIQTQLSSTDSNSKLLDRYKALDSGTSATAITTTVLTKPFNTQTSGTQTSGGESTPIGAIVGAIGGVLIVLAISYTVWRKRRAIRRRMPKRHTTTTDRHTVVTNSVANNSNGDTGGSFSKATTAADNPRRSSSDRKSGSMLIDLDSGIAIDVKGTNDDIEHGAAGANSIDIDTSL